MIEIFVVGCVMTIALFLAVFERKNVVKGDEVVSIGPGHWTVPNDQKLGDTSTSSGSSDESDLESEPENQQQIATQDYARCVQLRLHRFGEYRTRKEVNDLLILLVYYYTVIIKVLGVLLSNHSEEKLSIVKNVSTVTLYKEEEEFPVDDELPKATSKKKKTKNEKPAEEVYMPICLRKDDEAMYHEASIDNLDILISQRQKIESYISHLSESDVDIVKAVPAAIEKQPSITHDESNVIFNVSIEKKPKDDEYKPLIKKDAILSDIESLQAHIGDPKDNVSNELESLKSKLGYELTHKVKPESSIDESDASLPTLKSISIDDSDLDVSSSQITESEVISTELESVPDNFNVKLVDKQSVIPIVDLIEKVEKDNDQAPDQQIVYENSYHTGAIPKYSHPDANKTVTDQTSNSGPPVIKVETIKETDKDIQEKDSLICESKKIDTQETSKAEIVKLKSVEKDILDGSEDEDLEEDTEDSDVSIPDMKGSYTLQHEDYGVEEIYEDRDPLAFLLEGNEAEDDLSENFVDSFFSDDTAPCAPVADTTYHIDPILEEESEEDYSDQDEAAAPGPLQLKVPTLIEDRFAMTFCRSVEEDDNIDQSHIEIGEKLPDIDVEEKKDTDEIDSHIDIDQSQIQDDEKNSDIDVVEENKHMDKTDSHIDIHNYQNGNMQKEVLNKIKDLADKLDEIKKQELNVDCTIVEDITEDIVTIEFDNHLTIYEDEPYNSKLDQCKAFSADENLDTQIADTELTKEILENGILPSKEDDNSLSSQSQSQDYNANEQVDIVKNDTEFDEKSMETNYARESEDNCIGDNNEIAIEFDTPDIHYDELKSDYAKKNEDASSTSNINEMAIEFEIPDINSNEVNYNYAASNENFISIGDDNQMAIEFGTTDMNSNEAHYNYAANNEDIISFGDEDEMVIEFETPDMYFNEVKSSDIDREITNSIDESPVKISTELPPMTRIENNLDQSEVCIATDQRTPIDIVNSVVNDKSEKLFSEQESGISFQKGEEFLLDINNDPEFSQIDRCKAFSADAEPPEDFEYEGEAEYQKTVKLENFKNLENLQAAVVSHDECSHKIVLDVHEFRHGDLRVSAVGETEILVEAVSEVPENDAMQVRKFRQKFLLPETAAATDSIAALSSDGVLAIITPKKDGTSPSIKRKLPEDVETPEKSSKYMTKHDPRSNETEKSTIIDREMVECFMPILQRGNFFTDSIFQETRQDFNTAITEVLDKWGERSVHDPERGTHREEPKEDNQVMVITDDENNTRKILVDIADFTNDGEVKINVMDGELVVEGRTKKAEGSATSVKTFIRRFTLAPDIDPSAVTSVVTPDGILEITTPKKTVMPKLKEFSIQVIIELIVEESRTSPRKDSKSRKKLKDKSPGKDTDSSHSRKKKKIPEDGESEDYQNQAAGVSCDDDLTNKVNSENESVKLFEVSEPMAQLSSITGEDMQTGASQKGTEDSLGAKSSVTGENCDQSIIVSRDDENSDENDESQQPTESVESETQVHITDIKRFILEAHREFDTDDEAQQSTTLDTTDKSTPLEYKEESQQAIASTDEIDAQRKTVADLDSNVSFDEEDDSDWTLITPKEESVSVQTLKDEKQDKKEETCEAKENAEVENISTEKSDHIDDSQDYETLEDSPSKDSISEISSQEDCQPIPVILNGHSQVDNYEVGGDFKKLLSSFPEQLEPQSQDSAIEQENVTPIPESQENESKNVKAEKDDLIIKEEKRTTKIQKGKEISNKSKTMDYDDRIIDTKCSSDTKEVKLPEAYVTLATNDNYAISALVLGHSLRAVGTSRNLAIMITEAVSLDIRPMLHDVFNDVIIVNVMDSHDSAHLAQLQRPELGVTFTKLHCWTLVQYSKCVFLDADMFVLQNPDDLFDYPELSAAPDVGWPDCFNSGMFVFVPNTWTYHRLLQHAATTGSFDGGDQGVLNTFFPNWNCISFIYNMVASAVYTYIPAYINYGRNARIVHFIGPSKPWHQTFNRKTGEVETAEGYHYLRGFLNSWWKMYSALVEPGILSIFEARRLLWERSLERSPGFGDAHGFARWEQRDAQGFARWEYGNPDYLGQDSYMKIQEHIEKKISQYEISNKKKPSTKKQNLSHSTTDEDKDVRKMDMDDISQEKISASSPLSGDIVKKNNEIEEQVQEIIEVPEKILTSEKTEEIKQSPNLESEKSQKEDEESDWILVKSRRRKQSERYSESFEQQPPESTDKTEKYSMSSESYLPLKTESAGDRIEDKATSDIISLNKKKLEISQESIEKYESPDTSTSEVSSTSITPLDTEIGKSTLSYSDILKRKAKDEKESQSALENYDFDTPENLDKNTVHTSKLPELEIEETTYWPEKRPYWNIKATNSEAEYSSDFKSREFKSDDIETKSPRSTFAFAPEENTDLSLEKDLSTSKDIKAMSVRSKVKTVKDNNDLIDDLQNKPRKIEKESNYEIDDNKIWEMASLRYLGPKDTLTKPDNLIHKDNLGEKEFTEEFPKEESQTLQESYIPKPIALDEDIKEPSSLIEADVSSENVDNYDSLYSKYSMTSSREGTSLQKTSDIFEDKNFNEPYKSKGKAENIDISNRNSKIDETLNLSSNNEWESLLSSLDRKLDFASNLLKNPSSEMISGTTASSTTARSLSDTYEVDDKVKTNEKDNISPINKRKLEMHPEDTVKYDEKYQDAKQQKEQSQELMQQAWDDKTSPETSNDVSEANKNKLSSDEAKSLEDKAVSMKEAKALELEEPKEAKSPKDKGVSKKKSKASELEGSKDKLPSTNESKAEVSEVSLDIATKESENHEKKEVAQNEASNKAEKDSLSKPPSNKDQTENKSAESEVVGEPLSNTEKQKLATSETSFVDDNKLTTEQENLPSAESSVAAESKIIGEQEKMATAESSVTGEQKLTTEQEKIATQEISQTSEQKLTAEQEKLVTAESSVTDEIKTSNEQEKLATAESSVAGDLKSTAEQQKLSTADSSVADETKSSPKQQKLDAAESSVAKEVKSTKDQQEIALSESSATSELKSTTEKEKLGTAEDLENKEGSLKPTLETDISKQSTTQESSKAEVSSSQDVEKDATSTDKKSVKEKPKKDVSDESVRSKKSTSKKDASEKQETLSDKPASTAKLDIGSSIRSKRKEEEKSLSAKEAKALFQSQASAAAAGSTSDLRSAESSTGSSLGLRGTKSMSSSYSTLPGSSSPSSGYLATGTKSIHTGSFTFKNTEEYIKKKPPPRNRPFFNLRDFL